jgi:putative SOS response-associated peptidase YedK
MPQREPSDTATMSRRRFSLGITRKPGKGCASRRSIHAKAMPVLLTHSVECDTWLEGSIDEAVALQKPLPNEKLHIVATGEKNDRAPVDEQPRSVSTLSFAGQFCEQWGYVRQCN